MPFRFAERVRQVLAEPGSEHFEINDPRLTLFRRELVRRKPFLNAIYREWYSLVVDALPAGNGRVLELGSGAGFLHAFLPDLVTSEVFPLPDVMAILDGCFLPIRANALRAIVLIDVLHHIPEPRAFVAEAIRTLRPGGRILMVEPWVTSWSRFVYGHLHHEPFRPEATQWEFPSDGPLSGANGALPWMIFERDRDQFTRAYPELSVEQIRLMMPFRYLLSGGVSMRSIVPAWSFGAFRWVETTLRSLLPHIGMFAFIVVQTEKE